MPDGGKTQLCPLPPLSKTPVCAALHCCTHATALRISTAAVCVASLLPCRRRSCQNLCYETMQHLPPLPPIKSPSLVTDRRDSCGCDDRYSATSACRPWLLQSTAACVNPSRRWLASHFTTWHHVTLCVMGWVEVAKQVGWQSGHGRCSGSGRRKWHCRQTATTLVRAGTCCCEEHDRCSGMLQTRTHKHQQSIAQQSTAEHACRTSICPCAAAQSIALTEQG
jgi:hypothetical protein